MTTVASRTLRSTPYRDALDTWGVIVELLTHGTTGEARNELLAVTGVAASIIADKVVKDGPIVVTCDGPRTRIYCVYDQDAIEDSKANESTLGFDALKGDWRVSLPCQKDDLSWVQGALKKYSNRITARDVSTGFSTDDGGTTAKDETLVLDPRGFLES